MGNQLTGIAPSQIWPVEQYLTDVPEYEYDCRSVTGGTHRQTGDTQTDRGHTDRRGTHRQTGDTQTDRGHTDRLGTHRQTGDTQTDRGHTDRRGTHRQTGEMD
jgi:hypothetical protein